MKGYIYKLTLLQDTDNFKKGEIYIGQHYGENDYYYTGGKIVTRLLKKYSKNVFTRDILQDNIVNINILDLLEIYFISLYNCNRNRSGFGLNLNDGGHTHRGYKASLETKQKMSTSLKGRQGGMLGKTHSKKTLLKMQKARSLHTYDELYTKERNDKIREKHIIKVNSYNNTGTFLKTFNSLTDAALEYHLNIGYISKSCMEKISFSKKGIRFRYYEENFSSIEPCFKIQKSTSKVIVQYDKQGNFISEYRSIEEVKQKTNIAIQNCLYNRASTAGGYKWYYKENLQLIKI